MTKINQKTKKKIIYFYEDLTTRSKKNITYDFDTNFRVREF